MEDIRKKFLRKQSKVFQIMVYLGIFKFWVEECSNGNYPWICRKLRLWHPFVIMLFPFLLMVQIIKSIGETFTVFLKEGETIKYH